MTHRLSKPILLFCALIYGHSLIAQPMTLRDCMDYAVTHAIEMRLSAADRSDERAAHRQALLAAFTPSIGAQSYAYNQYGRNLDPETNTYTDFTTFHNGYSLSGSITLFDGFQALGKIRLAYLQSQKGLSHEQQCADGVRIAVMEAYYQLLYYRQLAEVLRQQCATTDSALTKVRREEELGRKGHADVVQIESELAERQYQLADAEGRRDQALLQLQETLCWPSDRPLLIVDQPEELEPLAALNSQFSTLNSDRPLDALNSQFSILNSDRLPAVRIARSELREAEIGVRQARSAWSPTLSLAAGWSTTYYTYPGLEGYTPLPFAQQWRTNGGKYLQLSLNIPLYSRGTRTLALRKSQNERVRAQVRLEQALREDTNALRRATLDVETAEASALKAQRMAQVKQQAFALSQRQFELGLISAIEYQTASQAHLSAQAENLNAQLQLRLKRHLLRYRQTGIL